MYWHVHVFLLWKPTCATTVQRLPGWRFWAHTCQDGLGPWDLRRFVY